jgi:F0F1-type ATP synthase membrane subunit b/b'
LALGAAVLFAAAPAFAAEGNLVLIPSLEMLGALIFLFVLLIFPVHALLFRPIFAVLDGRTEKIAGTRARAEKIAADADEVLARYESSVSEAREEAERERKEQLAAARSESADQSASARAEAEREIEGARAEIAAGLEEARASLRPQVELLAREAAARVLGRALS